MLFNIFLLKNNSHMLYHYAVQCYFRSRMWQEAYVCWSLCSGGAADWVLCDGNLKWHWNSSSLSDALTAPGSPGDPCTPDMKHVFCRRGIPIRENASRYYFQVKGSFAVTRLKNSCCWIQTVYFLWNFVSA